MTKKVITIIATLLFIIIIFSSNVFASTEEEINRIKQTTEELLGGYSNQNANEYLNNLQTVKEKLNESILSEENNENRIELQKLKLSVTKNIINIEMQTLQNNIENASINEGYQAPLYSAISSNNITLTEYTATTGAPRTVSFRGTAPGVDTSLANDEGLYCIKKGASLPSVFKAAVDGKDATLVVKDKNGTVTYTGYIDKVYAPGEFITNSKHYEAGKRMILSGVNLNRYGRQGIESDYYYEFENSRTIATYTSTGSRLKLGEAYIYAQSTENNGSSYPDICQQASWIYNGQMDNTTTSPIPTAEDADIEDADATSASLNAQQLAGEAIKFEELANSWATNKPTVTGDATKSEVTFDKGENSFYVGPITLQYERQTYPVANGATSLIEQIERTALKNHVAGLVEFSGINDIVCYDENGKVLTGVTFAIKTKVTRQTGDDTYIFPYPNEEFYVKIPLTGNENSTKFQKMTVEIFYLMADGNASTLNGTYVEQTFGGIAVPTICRCTEGVCKHGNETAHDDCQPIYCKDCFLAGYLIRLDTIHTKAFTHWIIAIECEEKSSQPLKHPTGAKAWINFDKIDIEINQDLVMEISGIVWEDERSEKASDYNGLIDSSEKGMEGIKVIAYLDGQEVASTYTDKDGKYKFEKLKIGDYVIGFEYDGQMYFSTRLLAIKDASGNITEGDLEAYRKNKTADIYKINSKALETEAERQAFNDNFYEITQNTAIGTDSNKNTLEYTTANRTSTLITRGTDGKLLDLYKMQARTAKIDFESVIVENINLGLVKRPKADFALNMDVYQANVRIKDIYQTYTYNQRQLDSVTSFEEALTSRLQSTYGTPNEYNQKLNPADYDWQWDEGLKEIYPDRYRAELQVYVDYKTVIRNQSENASGRITELVNYFDTELLYEPTTPVSDMASWIVINQSIDDDTIDRKEITWNTSSKYGGEKTYTGYNTMYTNGLSDIELQPGESIEIHTIYAVKKEGKIILDNEDAGKKNIVEINGYQTFLNNKVEGKIDNDSNSGNAVPDNNVEFEDDTDMAPYFRVTLDQNLGNLISGNVWEDLRTETLENGQRIGNGIRNNPEVEPNIGGVIVELVEVFSDAENTKEIEKVVKTTTTTTYTSNGSTSDGEYRFEQLPSGTYRVKFTYGADSQLQNNLKYNGQDYQATILNGQIEQSKSANIEIAFVIDTSGSMGGGKLTSVQNALSGENKLIQNLFNTIPGIKIGLVRFTSSANIIEELTEDYNSLASGVNAMSSSGGTNIASGVIKGSELLAKGDPNATKIMVVLTDGGSSPEPARIALDQAKNNGIIPIAIMAGSSASTSIFGTPDNPNYGPVYVVGQNDIMKTFTEDIYADIAESTIITENHSYATDKIVEPDDIQSEIIASQTRLNTMTNFKDLVNSNGKIIHIKDIEAINDETEKRNAITTFANNTYITAITNKFRVSTNRNSNIQIREINLGLTERPKVQLELKEEIAGIKITLANGTVLIDTENGLNNYVQGLNKKELPISISLDTELQQGATIDVKYKITITNTGDVDTLESYFEHYEQGSDELIALLSAYTPEERNLLSSYFNNNDTVEKTVQSVIPTKATTVYNYINSNMVFRQADNEQWEIVQDTSKLSPDVQNSIGQDITVIKLKDEFNKYLYPTSSKYSTEQIYLEAYLKLSKVLSPQSNDDTLTYKNSAEIVQRQNAVGRRDYEALPGNYIPNSKPTEHDSDMAQEIKIVPPYGEQRIYYILTAVVALILIGGVIITKKVLDQRKKS